MSESGNQRNRSTIIKVIVASPSDVQQERNTLAQVVDNLNRDIGTGLGFRIDLWRWETDASPGFNPRGPQGHIDKLMNIEDSDIVIGIFWKRFGSSTLDTRSGTEHELKKAWDAWGRNGRPQVMVYFKEAPYSPQSASELAQWQSVLEFKQNFPDEGLWWRYRWLKDFEQLVRSHLTRFLISQYVDEMRNALAALRDEGIALKTDELPILDVQFLWYTRVQHYQHINRDVANLDIEEAFKGESDDTRNQSSFMLEVANVGLQSAIRLQVSAEHVSGPVIEGYAEQMPLMPQDRRMRTILPAGAHTNFTSDMDHFSARSTWRIVFHYEDTHGNLWRTEATINLWDKHGVIPPMKDNVHFIPSGILYHDLQLAPPIPVKTRPEYLIQW